MLQQLSAAGVVSPHEHGTLRIDVHPGVQELALQKPLRRLGVIVRPLPRRQGEQ